jgi:hypothetical protein
VWKTKTISKQTSPRTTERAAAWHRKKVNDELGMRSDERKTNSLIHHSLFPIHH